MRTIHISIISPVYKAEKIVSQLVNRITNSIEPITLDYEIILVEDNSPDNSWYEIERNLLAKEMGEGGWHIQLDADEYFLRFNEFTNFLKKIPLSQKEINICVVLINLFKKTEKGFLYTMHNELELIQVATNRPLYEHGRRNGYFNFISPFFLLHNTWARNEEEIWQKISNWGHTSDFDTEKYFQFWKSVNEENFKNIKNFHPIYPSAWKALGFTEAKNIEELILKFSEKKFPLNKFQLFLINNRNIARIKHFWSKLFG